MKNCPNLQKSLDWCEGMPQLPGIRRRVYFCNKNLIVAYPTLTRNDFGRVTDAKYVGAFELAENAYWQYIDVNIDKSTVTSEPQGEVPSQTQLNKATFVHNGIDDEATAAAGFLNNSDCVIVYEDMRGHFRVLGNNKWRTLITVAQDQGQGTNPASTTINIEVTDMIAPPFYVEGLETEDGEVFPSYDDDAVLEPRLTSPSGTSFDIGAIADSGSSVSKTMHIQGVNLTEPLTLAKSGTGLTISKSTITVAEAKAGIDITLTYTKSTSGAGSLNGSLRIYSAEVDKTITVTARKEAADVQPTEGPTNETPEGVMGLVFDPAMNVNGFFSDANVSAYPSSAKRQTVAVPVSEKFPAVPSSQRHYQDTSMDTTGGPEKDFVLNTAFEDFAPIEAKNVKGFLSKTMGTKISHNSIFLLNPQKTGSGSNNYKETSVATSWRATPQTEIINVANLNGYAATNKYYLCQNFKKTSGSTDTVMTAEAVYREDFDTIILPNTWRIHDLLETNYQSLFPKDQNYAGGMAIYGNYIVQVFTTGKIVVLNKTTLELVASGVMSIAADNMHGNAVSFGISIPSGAVVPYLYVSQWTAGYCYCHVLKVTWTNGTVTTEGVQTISYSGTKFKTGTQYSNWDWSVDAKTGNIWCIGYAASATDRYGAKVALKFALPAIPTHAATTQFTDSDIVKEFDFTFAGAQQDFHIENDLAFWEFSYNNGNGTGGVMIIDLANNTMLNDYIIDLQSTGREPEGVCRDGSLLYITSHQGGNNNFNLKLHVVDLLQTNLDEE